MRLTLVLQKYSTIREWKEIWKHRGRFPDYPLKVPRILQEKGVEIVDPTVKEKLPKWEPPVDDPRYWKPVPLEEQINYNEEPAYIITPKVRLIEGIKHACILGKTEERKGFPSSVEKLIDAVEIPNQDHLLQRYIMQSQVWNPTMDKLPKRIDKSKVGWHFQREYGILPEKSAMMLLRNMLRLCHSLAGRYPGVSTDRRLIYKPYVGTHYYFKDKLINIQGLNEWLISTNSPLQPFANEDAIDATANYTLPDIYPISPLIDLFKEHCYTVQNQTGFQKDHTHSHPHTFFMLNKNYWRTEQRQARSLLFCLGYAIAQARKRFGDDIKTLPEPISVQCVNMDQTTLNFIFFQLNTTNFSTEDGIKNIAWFDGDNRIFEKLPPQPWLGPEFRKTRYENYDPVPFKKLLAVFLNDINECVPVSN